MKAIAVDAMGGDYAPVEIVRGALDAVRSWRIPVVLVGDEAQILPLVKAAGMTNDPLVKVQHASQVIGMDEHPGMAYRKKKDASIVVAAKLVKEGHCGALVAPGSTGAAVTAGLFGLGRIKGIRRPAIATPLPTQDGGTTLLIDSGASANPGVENLLQNALLGHVFMQRVYGIVEPRVGLLNIGTEEIKGSNVVTEVYPKMQEQSVYRFIGNVEGRDIPKRVADVVVCDGFTGNVVLKFAEGMATMMMHLLKDAVMKNGWRAKLGGWLLRPALKQALKKVDYAEYGGAPLLGVEGGLVICHGASKARAIQNAVRLASHIADSEMVEHIKTALETVDATNEE